MVSEVPPQTSVPTVKFSQGTWLLTKLHLNLSIMLKMLYALLNNNNLDPIFGEKLGDIGFKSLKESLMSPPTLGNSNNQIRFFLFVYKKERNVRVILTPKHEDFH